MTVPTLRTETVPGPARTMQRIARSLVLGRMRHLAGGSLRIRDAFGEVVLGDETGARHAIRVHDPVLWTDLLGGGLLGAGEAYTAGAWTTEDLPGLVQLFLRNRKLMGAMDGGLARVMRPLMKTAHRLQRNSREACRRYIAAHYDLGNDFFALFLDPSMTYSAGVFDHRDTSLEEAQLAKYGRLANKLDLQPGMHVLEIGCGWGGFAEYAASRHGCQVTATTISERQFEYARERIERAGLRRRVGVVFEDYRDLTGTFDRVVSIEMVEAVGHGGLPSFARTCAERLAPHGALGLQAITIDDRHYDRARKTIDFIKRYIFPGSFIPSSQALHEAFVDETDMRLLHLEDIGLDYARTLAAWRERFLARADDIRALGLDDAFIRMWDYYFAYCEGGFRERFLGDVQMVLARPDSRLDPRRGLAARIW